MSDKATVRELLDRMTIRRIVDHIVLTEDGTRIQSLRALFDYTELVPAGG